MDAQPPPGYIPPNYTPGPWQAPGTWSVAGMPGPTPRPGLLATLSTHLTTLVVLGVALFVAYDRWHPAVAPAPPDRVEAASRAYLAMQPRSLREVAASIRSGSVDKAKVGEAIRAAHTPAAADLQAALAESVNLADALERAAAAMEGGLKKP